MGRLAVILGCNALGPGGERDRRGGGRARGGDRPAPRRRDAPTSSPTRSTTPPTCGRWSSRAATGCWRSPRSARLRTELPVGTLLCPDDFIALHLGLSIFADARAHSAPGFDRALARRSDRGLGGEAAQAPRRRRRLLADDRAALRDPGRDPADRRARRRGRDDDRLRVRRRRRARPRVRGALHGRQPRQRARRRRARASPRWKPTASPTRPACATASPRCCRGSARSADERLASARRTRAGSADRHRRRRSTASGRAALRRRADRGARAGRRRRARRRDDRRRRRAPRAAAGQRPHPRGDDPLPRHRRRPAADALAGGADLAGRGEARGRGRLLGRAPRLRGDDPLRHDPLLGHVLAPRGDRAGGRRRRHAGDDRGAAVRRRPRPGGDARGGPEQPRRTAEPRRPSIPPALAPHAIYTVSEESLRWIAELAAEREVPIQIHLSETAPGGRGLPRRPRRAARRLPRPARAAERAHGARPRRLARPTRSWS